MDNPNDFWFQSSRMQQQQLHPSQQKGMQFFNIQKTSPTVNSKVQQRAPAAQVNTSQSQNSAVSLNIKTDQILNQLHTLACNTQAQTENTEKLQQRLQKSEETLEGQKRLNQSLRMENGKIIEQLRLSKCSMEQLEVQVQSLVSNVEEQRVNSKEIQEKLSFAKSKYEESRIWKEGLEDRLRKTILELQNIREENEKRISDLNAEIEAKDVDIDAKGNFLQAAELKNNELNVELSDLKDVLKARDAQIILHQSTIEEAKQQSNKFEAQLMKSDKELNDFRAQLELVTAEKTQLAIDKISLQDKVAADSLQFETRLKDQSERSDLVFQEFQQKVAARESLHAEEKNLLKSRVQKLEQELNAKDDNLKALTQVLSSNETKIREQHQKITDLNGIIAELESKCRASNSRNSELEKAREELSKAMTNSEMVRIEGEIGFTDALSGLESAIASFSVYMDSLYSNQINFQAASDGRNAAQQSAFQNIATQLKDAQNKFSESSERILSLENALREAEHKADEKIKHNLFEAQKHLNVQIISMKEEHLNQVSKLQAEKKSLKDDLTSWETENARLRTTVENFKKLEEQNDKLRSELLHESSRVEHLSSELDEKHQRIVELEKENDDYKLSRQLSLHGAPGTASRTSTTHKNYENQKETSLSKSVYSDSAVGAKANQLGNDVRKHTMSQDIDSETGCVMKKRALGPSSKVKSSQRLSSSSKKPAPVSEPPTLRKQSLHQSRTKDLNSWDDGYAEFDLFSSSVDLH